MKHPILNLLGALAILAAPLPHLRADPIPLETIKHDVYQATIISVERFLDPAEGAQLGLDFTSPLDLPYEVRSTSNLQNWVSRATVTPANGAGLFVEPFPPAPRRFYQVAFVGTSDQLAPAWAAGATLSVEGVYADGIHLSWPAADDDHLVAYAIYHDGHLLARVDPSTLEIFVESLAPYSRAQFDLVACDAGGNCTQLPDGLAVQTRATQEPALNPTRVASTFPATGEFILVRTDLAIGAREAGAVFTRTYRSHSPGSGPIGRGWSTNLFEHLRERPGGDVAWHQGNGRTDVFARQANLSYTSPEGVFSVLSGDGAHFRLLAPNGTTRLFDSDGKILSLTTRNGNARTYHYSGDRLTSIRDDMGRETTLAYDGNDRLTTVTDFTGRQFLYQYDPAGNLAGVRSPVITGTPTGNDFPAGRTERYVYDTGNPDPLLAHKLVQVIAPNEVADGSLTPCQIINYGTNEFGLGHGHVTSHTVGGTNASGVPAGGTYRFSYTGVPCSGDSGAPRFFCSTTVTDPRGHDAHYDFNPRGHLTRLRVEVAGQSDPVTTYTYDADGRLLATTHPERDVTTRVYGSAHPSRRSQGNLLSVTRTPGPRGADQPQLTTSYTYEPVYNQLRTVTDPRGFTTMRTFDYEEDFAEDDLRARIGATAAELQSYFAASGLAVNARGDVNRDGIVSQVSGNVIRVAHPVVTLDPDSNQAAFAGRAFQDGTDIFIRNRFGQLTVHRDAEHNVHQWVYFSERDPDGDGTIDNPDGDPATGGYPAMTVRDAGADPVRNSGTDPAPTRITERFEVNERGMPTARFDPRGIRTRYFRNDLDEIIQVVQADALDPAHPNLDPEPVPPAPLGYFAEFRYDANGNLVCQDVEDRANTSNTSGTITTEFKYTILRQLAGMSEEIKSGSMRETCFRRDPNGNLGLVILHEGNAVARTYDERNLLQTVTTGATAAPPEALLASPRTFNPRGGTPSTVTYSWTANGNLAALTDAADTDGSPANNGPAGGDLTTFQYDGYDRLLVATDSLGNQALRAYDASGNLTELRHLGPDGGPSPLSNNPGGGLLGRHVYHYDERNRRVRVDRHLFANTNAADLEEGASALGKGDPVPGDGAVNNLFEYDLLDRPTFRVQGDGDVTAYRYDGAGRLISTTDPVGNRVEIARCDIGNPVEIRETDRATLAGVPDDVLLTTFLYDALNRRTTMIDNGGHTWRYEYDSRGNLTAMSDPNGPPSGTAITRRAFPDAAGTINAVNGHGNVTRRFYDGLNREIRVERILTADGLGDGTLNPAPDPAQGGGDGIATTQTHYDGNNLVTARLDDNQFRTEYGYDNLNRLMSQSQGACAAPLLTGYRCDPHTALQFSYDADHNLTQKTDEAGNVFHYGYDAANRRVLTDSVPVAVTTGATRQTFEYDGLGRLTRCTDNQHDIAVSRHYDSLSRLVAESIDVPGSGSFTTRKAWSAENLCRSLTYPTGTTVGYQYDARDRVRRIEDGGGALADYHYLGRRVLRETCANGMRNEYRYDHARRPRRVEALDAGGDLLTRFDYTWNRTNRRLDATKGHDPLNSEDYQYDSLYRLTSLARPNPGATAPLQSSWKFDGAGNAVEVDGVARTVSSFNELAEVGSNSGSPDTLVSDDNGNLRSDPTSPGGGATYEYDIFNRLIRVSNSGTELYAIRYDGLGRRISETSSAGHETVFVYDGGDLLLEWDATGDLIGTPGTAGRSREYVRGPQAVCNDGSPGVYYARAPSRPLRFENGDGDRFFCHHNSLGSVSALTPAAGGAPNQAERITYEAYGRATVTQTGGMAPTGNPLLYAGQRKCTATGLYFLPGARPYDPDLGRFLGRHPSGGWEAADSLGNAYAFSGNDPVNADSGATEADVVFRGSRPGARANSSSGYPAETDGISVFQFRDSALPVVVSVTPAAPSPVPVPYPNSGSLNGRVAPCTVRDTNAFTPECLPTGEAQGNNHQFYVDDLIVSNQLRQNPLVDQMGGGWDVSLRFPVQGNAYMYPGGLDLAHIPVE